MQRQRGTEVKYANKYSSWTSVAAYFDGDGSVDFDPRPFVLKLRLAFVDNWKPQLVIIKKFLESKGIKTGVVEWRKASVAQREKGARGVYVLRISNRDGVLTLARRMLPHSMKKASELEVVIDYYEDGITGNEAIQKINGEVELGKRTGKIKRADLPFTYSKGRRAKDIAMTSQLRLKNTFYVPDEIVVRMNQDYYETGLTLRDISRIYRYGMTIVRRVLGRPH